MTQLPTISAVVCAYNYEAYVAEAIDSVLAQDYPQELIEIVVVDDGSTDGTPDVLASYGDRIRVLRQPNAGLRRATERGLVEAEHDLIALLDADDAWQPDKLRRQVERLAAMPGAGLVVCDKMVVDAAGEPLAPSFWAMHGLSPVEGRALPSLVQHNFASASTLLLRRELVGHVVPMPTSAYWQDWWIAVALAQVAEVAVVDAPLVRYRSHGGNMTMGATGAKQLENAIANLLWRRWMLVELPLDGLHPDELRRAWAALAQQARSIASSTKSTVADVLRITEHDRAVWRVAMGVAGAARAGGDPSGAMRAYLVAMASDPSEPQAARAFTSCACEIEDQARMARLRAASRPRPNVPSLTAA